MTPALARRHRTALGLLMLVSLAAALTAPDHWLPAVAASEYPISDGHSHSHETRAREADDGVHHARHCHNDAASCSDAPLTSASGLALLAAFCGFAVLLVSTPILSRAGYLSLPWAPGTPDPPPRPVPVT